MRTITIKQTKSKMCSGHHPWLFSGGISRTEPGIQNGDIVRLISEKNDFIAYAFYNGASKIALRLLEWDEAQVPDEAWFGEKISASIQHRKELLAQETSDSCRLVFSEADLLPGLIVDKFGSKLALQLLTAGMDRLKPLIIDLLVRTLSPECIWDKSSGDMRKREGLTAGEKLLYGPQNQVTTIRENSLVYSCPPGSGQKTGFYLDQRENRAGVAACAPGLEVLDCFCYTGGFALNCLKKGALKVDCVDSSAPALAQAAYNMELNGFAPDRYTLHEANVFDYIRELAREGKTYDLVILDPPKLCPSPRDREKALRSYKDVNMHALHLIKKNGYLATFSCSGAISREDLRLALAYAALDARKDVQIVQTLGQPLDHPVRLSFPESEYLKGFICRVL